MLELIIDLSAGLKPLLFPKLRVSHDFRIRFGNVFMCQEQRESTKIPSKLQKKLVINSYALWSHCPIFAQNVVMYKYVHTGKRLYSGFCNVRSEGSWQKSRVNQDHHGHNLHTWASSFGQNEESVLCNVARWVRWRWKGVVSLG